MANAPILLPFPVPKAPVGLRPEDAVELRRLYEELPYAALRAAETLRTDGTMLRGDDLLPFRSAESAVAEIVERINAILEQLFPAPKR